MIIGTSRIGIGRLGIRSGNANILELLSNASIFERIAISTLSNASIVDINLLYLYSNADIDAYNRRQVLSNASIIGQEIPSVLSNASIAALLNLGISSNATVLTTAIISMISNAAILEQVTPSVLSNASICGPSVKELSSNASIAALIALESLSNASIADRVALDMESNANIAILRQSSLQSNAYIVDMRYWSIGPEDGLIDISGHVYEPEPKGFGLRTSAQRVPGGRRVILQDGGVEGGQRSFTVVFSSDSARQSFQEIVNNDAEDLILYCGRSDRYQIAKKISVEPEYDDLWRGQAALKVTCELEDQYHYHAIDQGLDLGACPLPQDDTNKYNYGTVEAPLLFRVGGQYAFTGGSGGPGEETRTLLPHVICLDGSTEETDLSLGPALLSNEFCELTRDGSQRYYLTHTYYDTFDDAIWLVDGVQSGGCSRASGEISIPAECWFYLCFDGYPLKEDIQLEATITTATSPIIQYSIDGVTWITAIDASEIVSGVKKIYYLSGTEKKSKVYVRFYSPVGASMTIQDINFTLLRDISAQYDQIPMVPVGESRALRVTGSGSNKAKIRTTFRSRWHAQ